MNVIKIFLGGLIATSLMTLFSYLVSYVRSSRFKEPELLNSLIKSSSAIPLNPSEKNIKGWLIHYLIGWVFMVFFDIIWTYTVINPSLLTGSLLGLLAGFIGIAGWRIMFRLNNDPPEIPFRSFYLHLLIAHIIFGAGASLVYLF